jgi:hypothetical protein
MEVPATAAQGYGQMIMVSTVPLRNGSSNRGRCRYKVSGLSTEPRNAILNLGSGLLPVAIRV